MNYKHFGEFLKYIRTSNNLTIEQLAEGVCSTRQLIRIEKGDNDPSLHVLHHLSIKLNLDLQEYYRIQFCTGSFSAHSYKDKLEGLIVARDHNSIRQLIQEIENLTEFQKGENLQYIFYGKALYSAYLDENYIHSNDYCLKGLTVEDSDFSLDTIKDKIYSNVGLTMVNLLAGNYIRLNEQDKSHQIFEDLFHVLDNQIFNSPFPMYRSLDFQKKLYQGITNNLGAIFMDKGEYDKSLNYINKGIELSLRESYMRFLPELLHQKSRLLFRMGDFAESYKTYEICLSFYKLSRSSEDIHKLEKEIEEKKLEFSSNL